MIELKRGKHKYEHYEENECNAGVGGGGVGNQGDLTEERKRSWVLD